MELGWLREEGAHASAARAMHGARAEAGRADAEWKKHADARRQAADVAPPTFEPPPFLGACSPIDRCGPTL
eukprot:5988497-Prymnesium_polylepis.1